jgi:hypothetical protein
MYRGRHRRRSQHRRVVRASLTLTLICLALMAPTAAAWSRPTACRGGSPAAVWVTVSVSPGSIPEGESVTFTYSLSSGATVVDSQDVVLSPDRWSASVVFSGVQRGSYTVREEVGAPFFPGPDEVVVVDPPACAPVVSYTHSL